MRPPTLLGHGHRRSSPSPALIAMLGVHIALRANDDLSPWKGAGFAMFSTVDSPGMRTVAVWADVAGVEERVSLPEPWDDASGELRALPTPARTMALARRVASSTLVRRADGTLAPATTRRAGAGAAGGDRPRRPGQPPPRPPGQAVVEVDRVRVDVMKLSYDGGRGPGDPAAVGVCRRRAGRLSRHGRRRHRSPRPAGGARRRRPPPASARAGHRSHAGRRPAATTGAWYVAAPVSLLAAAALVCPELRDRPLLWWALLGCLGAGVHQVWTQADNHQYLIIYWVLAVALAAGSVDPAARSGGGRTLAAGRGVRAGDPVEAEQPGLRRRLVLRVHAAHRLAIRAGGDRVIGGVDAHDLDANRTVFDAMEGAGPGASVAPARPHRPAGPRWRTC